MFEVIGAHLCSADEGDYSEFAVAEIAIAGVCGRGGWCEGEGISVRMRTRKGRGMY